MPTRPPATRSAARPRLAGAALLAAALLGGCQAPPPPPRAATPVEAAAAGWRADAGLPAGTPDELVARGGALLLQGSPARAGEARAAFRAALVRDPARLDAVAGLATAFADAAGQEPDGEGLKEAHALLGWALAQAPGRGDLLAGKARLLLLVPSAANATEARAVAAQAAAVGAPGAVLAAGLALMADDPAAAAARLEQAAAATPSDARLLAAAAEARYRAGDELAALAHAEALLARDPLHVAALELAATVEADAGLAGRARQRLAAWRARAPGDGRAALLEAQVLAQAEGDLGGAAALLDDAVPHAAGDFLAARLLAARAAVALARGDEPVARRAVAAALARVPASAPASYQAARLAFSAGDRAALREAAGVVGGRCGRPAALWLAARQAELGSATREEAVAAWQAVAAAAPRDPAAALATGGALARLGYAGPALALARQATRADPLEARLRPRLAECWEGSVALVEAAARYEAMARAEPPAAARALTAAAAASLLLGQTAAAEQRAARAAALDPQAGEPRLLLAQVALDRGRAAEALRWAAAAADLPGGEVAGGLTARALLALRRLEPAERAGRAAAEAERGGAAARLGHARILLRLGRVEEARAVALALLSEDPGAGPARAVLLEAAAPAPPPRR